MSIGIKHYKKLTAELKKLEKAPKTVLDRTLSDARSRVPGWVSAEVAKQYGISKKEVGDGKTSKLKVQGKKLPTVELEYSGRVLTPTHFKMSPTAPKPNRGGYTLKASILRDKKTTLGKVKKLTKKQQAALAKNFRREGTQSSDHSPIMLMGTGNTRVGGTDYIPFQRKSTNRKDVQVIKTVSVPQMIDSDRVSPNIQKAIDDGIGKRLEHHLKMMQK